MDITSPIDFNKELKKLFEGLITKKKQIERLKDQLILKFELLDRFLIKHKDLYDEPFKFLEGTTYEYEFYNESRKIKDILVLNFHDHPSVTHYYKYHHGGTSANCEISLNKDKELVFHECINENFSYIIGKERDQIDHLIEHILDLLGTFLYKIKSPNNLNTDKYYNN